MGRGFFIVRRLVAGRLTGRGAQVAGMFVATSLIYDSYAPIYDAIGQGRFGARMAASTLRWLDDRGAPPRRVLDLACGSGTAALVFAAAGCAIVGVDRSAAMLAIARGKARDAGGEITFVQADLRDLPADVGCSSFDLATCFYDSLNYMTGDGDLTLVFASVARALRPGGYLVFDMNTEAEYQTWDERDVVTRDSRDYLVYNRLNYDRAARLATGRIVWFVREIERWWRGEETHVERAWGDAEVRAALEGAGLALAARLTPEGAEAGEQAPRVVYMARKE